MKAYDIQWDTDGEEVYLPTEMEIPDEVAKEGEDAISDYLSDQTGFCHTGFMLDTDASADNEDEGLSRLHELAKLVSLERLKELAEADAKGMVLVSKIPIGTKVYQINQETKRETRIVDGEEYYREVPDWYVSYHEYSWTDAIVDAENPERSGNPRRRYFFSKEEALAECARINAGGDPSKVSDEK